MPHLLDDSKDRETALLNTGRHAIAESRAVHGGRAFSCLDRHTTACTVACELLHVTAYNQTAFLEFRLPGAIRINPS